MRNEKGFSIMEIMVAIGIIALITGGGALAVNKMMKNAKVKRAKSDIQILSQAIDLFEMDNLRFPNGLDELVNDPGELPNYQPGGYLKDGKVPKDPWGADYLLVLDDVPEGMQFDIMSYGEKGQEGGDGYEKDLRLSETKE